LRRLILVAVLVSSTLTISGCLGPLGTLLFEGTGSSNIPPQFDVSAVPASIRSDVASTFPDYEVVDAQVGDDDVILTLSHLTRRFFMTEQYDRSSPRGQKPVRWTRNDEGLEGIDFADRTDPRARSFVEFFVALHPEGDYIFDGLMQTGWRDDFDDYEASLFPMRATPVAFGLVQSSVAHTERYRYDHQTSEWSER